MQLRYLAVAAAVVLATLLFNVPPSAQQSVIGPITVSHPWARATPPRAATGAAYLTLLNASTEPDRLVEARTPVAEAVEFHESTTENGISRMRPVDAIELPAGGQAVLGPGGLHLMLIGLDEPLVEGMSFPLTLRFERAGEATVDIAVQAIGATPDDAHHHH